MTISDDVRAADVLTRNEAIDRMKAGLPCETCTDGVNWSPTWWGDFDRSIVQFRKPPEPRRVAREFWVCLSVDGQPFICTANYVNAFLVREVLPGDVTLQRMTRDELLREYCRLRPVNGWTKPADAVIEFARALGLIADKSAVGEGA